MTRMHYLAYGSNLHPSRLAERVPSARLVGTVRLAGCRLMFHKRGGDLSGKCNIYRTANTDDHVHGALYEMAAAHKSDLDRFEGVSCGYRHLPMQLICMGRSYSCFTYIAESTHIDDDLRPYHWYKALVVLGAEYLGLPGGYIAGLHAVDALEDPDRERRAEHEALIARMQSRRMSPVST
jgi:gamma-glutamylcyclotransferase (GGCT)/AIG2-like uncharacterized protein YtfP